MGKQVCFQRPAALQDMPWAYRSKEEHEQRVAAPQHATGKIPENDERKEADRQHGQPQGELAQAEYFDKRRE